MDVSNLCAGGVLHTFGSVQREISVKQHAIALFIYMDVYFIKETQSKTTALASGSLLKVLEGFFQS